MFYRWQAWSSNLTRRTNLITTTFLSRVICKDWFQLNCCFKTIMSTQWIIESLYAAKLNRHTINPSPVCITKCDIKCITCYYTQLRHSRFISQLVLWLKFHLEFSLKFILKIIYLFTSLLTIVCFQVLRQVIWTHKTLGTSGTDKSLLARMRPDMSLKLVGSRERLAA